MASFPGQPGCKSPPKRLNQSDFNEARDDGVAVASAGPYANHLHLDADRYPRQYLNTVFTCWMLFLMPNQQCQSTEGMILTATAAKFLCTQ